MKAKGLVRSNKDGKRHADWALLLAAGGRLGVKVGAVGSYQHNLFDDVAPEWVEVDLKVVTVEGKQVFGGSWLGLELCHAIVRYAEGVSVGPFEEAIAVSVIRPSEAQELCRKRSGIVAKVAMRASI